LKRKREEIITREVASEEEEVVVRQFPQQRWRRTPHGERKPLMWKKTIRWWKKTIWWWKKTIWCERKPFDGKENHSMWEKPFDGERKPYDPEHHKRRNKGRKERRRIQGWNKRGDYHKDQKPVKAQENVQKPAPKKVEN